MKWTIIWRKKNVTSYKNTADDVTNKYSVTDDSVWEPKNVHFNLDDSFNDLSDNKKILFDENLTLGNKLINF